MTSNRASCEWTVTAMDCGSCGGKIRGAIERLPGVSDVDVALMAERLRLTLDETQTPRERAEAAVKALGFGIAKDGAATGRKGFVMPGEAPAAGEDGVAPAPDATVDAPDSDSRRPARGA